MFVAVIEDVAFNQAVFFLNCVKHFCLANIEKEKVQTSLSSICLDLLAKESHKVDFVRLNAAFLAGETFSHSFK